MKKSTAKWVILLLVLLAFTATVSAQTGVATPQDEIVTKVTRNEYDIEPAFVEDAHSNGINNLPAGFEKTAAQDVSGEIWTYIIRLKGPSVSQYEGGIPGLNATSPRATGATRLDMSHPDSIAYAEHLAQGRESFIGEMDQAVGRDVTVSYEYYVTLNGLAAELTAQEVLIVADLFAVEYIEPDQIFELETNAGPQWINADAIWAGVGGLPGTFGEGVIVGVIDTGINPDHASFADIGGDGYDHSNPWGTGNYAGVCDPADPTYDPTFPCNDKLIGAWGYPTVNGGDPTDADGHGSHTASTAAGNVVLNAPMITPNGFSFTDDITGVAPHANVIMYAACCTGSALSAARDQVVIDGVDAVNYSIGSSSPTADPWGSSFSLQWLAVRDAGIFVATSAGNAGNGFETIGSPGDLPWMTTIGASTHDLAYLNSVVDMFGGDTAPPADVEGRSVTIGYGPAPIVYAADYGDALCQNPFPAGTFPNGEIVVCDRGVIARVGKGTNVQAGGAGGMLLAEVTPGGLGSLAADTHVLPAVHITDIDGIAIKAWLASGTGHMATITGTTLDQNDVNGDIMAKFSSRGANRALPDIIKPNVTAPGVGIFAAFNDGVEYNIIQGTSMASPHVAGAGALMRALHPDWTVAEIESALMSTSNANVYDNDAVTQADPFAMGAGRVDLAQAGVAGLLLDVTTTEFEAANPADGGVPNSLNLASMGENQCVGSCSWTRTVENVLSTTGSWTASTSADTGMSISVSPSSFTLDPGATQDIVVTANLSGAVVGEWLFGTVNLVEDGGQAPDTHMPVAAAFSPGSLPSSVDIVTRRNAGSQLVTNLQAIEITDLTTTVHGLTKGDITEESMVSDPTNGDPYDGGFDPQVDGTFFVTVDVPVGATSFIAETIFSESPDLDLYVGSGIVPSAATELCVSASGSAIEFCELATPTPGTYWVLIQNWDQGNGPALPGQLAVLSTAVVPEADAGNMTVVGPSSVPAGTPFDLRVYWDTPTMAAGDRWYGSFDLGSDPGNPGNIGTIPVYIQRVEDDVTKVASPDTALPGDTVMYTITVEPNVTPEDLAYTITDVIPAGMTYVPASATATAGTVDVTGDTLTWTGTMLSPIGLSGGYVVTNSDNDPSCDTGFGGYVDLEGFGLFPDPGVTGDTVGFTAFSTGDMFSYYGNNYAGMGFTDDGFAIFDIGTNNGGSPWIPQTIPDATLPNNVLPAYWHDFEIFYDEALNHGVSLATSGAPGGVAIIEYDDIQLFGGSASVMDFEIVMARAVDNTPGVYEIVYAYDNISSTPVSATIGVENVDGTDATSLVNNGDASGVISNGFMVCFDYTGASLDPAVITYEVTVDVDAVGTLTNNVEHDTDNPGSLPATTSVDVMIEDGVVLGCNLPTVGFEFGVPAAWETTDIGGPTWSSLADCVSPLVDPADNWTGGAGDAMCANSDNHQNTPYDAQLISNPFTIQGSTAQLDYKANYNDINSADDRDLLDLDISTDGGTTWINLLSWNEDHGAPEALPGEDVSVDLSTYTGQTAQVRWRYHNPYESAWDWYAQVDEVSLSCDDAYDFSDAPVVYGTAWHADPGEIGWLGATVTADPGAMPPGHDNADGSNDGVMRTNSVWVTDGQAQFDVTVSGGDGYLTAWFDWDADGSFDPADQVVSGIVSVGVNNFDITIPNNYATGTTLQSRFRLIPITHAPQGDSPNGGAFGGEVEDYTWGFTTTAIDLRGFNGVGMTTSPILIIVALLGVTVAGFGLFIRRRRTE